MTKKQNICSMFDWATILCEYQLFFILPWILECSTNKDWKLTLGTIKNISCVFIGFPIVRDKYEKSDIFQGQREVKQFYFGQENIRIRKKLEKCPGMLFWLCLCRENCNHWRIKVVKSMGRTTTANFRHNICENILCLVRDKQYRIREKSLKSHWIPSWNLWGNLFNVLIIDEYTFSLGIQIVMIETDV